MAESSALRKEESFAVGGSHPGRVNPVGWKPTTFTRSGKVKGMRLGHCPPVTKTRSPNGFPLLDVARNHLLCYYIFVSELSNGHTTSLHGYT